VFDTLGCFVTGHCGDGLIGDDEECDGDDLGGETCESLYLLEGALGCLPDCSYDDSQCHPPGDGLCDVPGGDTQLNAPDDCGFRAISMGGQHACGIRKDLSLWCWGSNTDGELGDGSTTASPVPVLVDGLTGVRAVSAGKGSDNWGAHSCAILIDGTAWCWGTNWSGQLGEGTTYALSSTPVQVVGLTDVEVITAGSTHTCATTSAGELYCWGYGSDCGQLGLGTFTSTSTPTLVPGLTDVVDVSASDGWLGSHTCAVAAGGDIYCWGCNRNFVLGIDNWQENHGPRESPSLVEQTSSSCQGFVQVSASYNHGCGRTAFGVLCCWGSNYNYQTTGSSNPPAFQVPPEPVSAFFGQWDHVTAGALFTCGRLHTGQRICYGFNEYGSVGLGFTSEEEFPTPLPGFDQPGLVSAGGLSACATKDDSTLWCWGLNDTGQLGNGTVTDASSPVPVAY
jgi:alpha-tubulin suppressor-like RCC1 family protein